MTSEVQANSLFWDLYSSARTRGSNQDNSDLLLRDVKHIDFGFKPISFVTTANFLVFEFLWSDIARHQAAFLTPSFDFPAWSKNKKDSVRCYLFFFTNQDEVDLLTAIGSLPSEGFLSVLACLSDSDRVLPICARWEGAHVSPVVLGEYAVFARDFLSSLSPQPEVPAPRFDSNLERLIIEARKGERPPELVPSLLGLDDLHFVEAIDRLYPWISDPEGPAAWVDKNDPIADKLWDIVQNSSHLSQEDLRNCSWKTGMGQWGSLNVRIYSGWRGNSINPFFCRSPDGGFEVCFP